MSRDLAELVHEHRMLDTFGGYDWGDPIRLWTVTPAAPTPVQNGLEAMPWDDLIEELEHFKSCGVSGAVTVQQLGLNPRSVLRRCERRGRSDLASWINATTERWKEAA